MSVLKIYDRGHEVRKLQLLLNAMLKPSPNLKLDGIFGKRTHRAVVSFQRSKDLEPDGLVGPKTRSALGLKSAAVPIAIATAPSAPWMDIAVAELGVHEDSLPGKHNGRIIEYHRTTTLKSTRDETPWCSSFVNWVMRQSGKRGTNSAAARSWLKWGMEVARPTLGNIAIIKRKTSVFKRASGLYSGYHVGFLVSLSFSHIRLLGGNQGNQVRYYNFRFNDYEIKGFRRPI